MPSSSSSIQESADDAREELFEWALSPWKELGKLQYGGDRSFAHGVENEVLTARPKNFSVLEHRLLGVLKEPEVTLAARDFVCRMLALIGTEASIAALVPMLKDARTRHFARLALERIPGEKAKNALAGK